MTWEQIAEAKRAQLWDAIPQKWQHKGLKEEMVAKGYKNTSKFLDTIVPKEELEITSLTLLELKDKLQKGVLTATAVAEAYCHRAALAQQILNCLSEIFFDKALEKAKELDEYYAKNGKTVGELHGVPISLKDQVDLPGFDSAVGYVALLNKPKTKISLLAEYLQNAGAVFYVKTTVPTAMMSPETNSNVYGYTFNSQGIELTSGGSSGGEGALIGAGASPLGFGTDIGGSIRLPSAFNGLYALKPTPGRISYLRVTNSYSGQETMPSVIGPMGRSLGDIQYITKFIIDGGLWEKDPKVLPIPYQNHDDLKTGKLTVGVWKFDQKVMPHPPVLRGIAETVKKLEAKGHEVIEIELPRHTEIIDLVDRTFTADQGYEVNQLCKEAGEPVVENVDEIITNDRTKPPITVNPWWDICNEHYKEKEMFLEFWRDTAKLTKSGKPIDAILAPVWPSTAYKPRGAFSLNYTSPFNLLQCPSVVIPVTRVDAEKDPVTDYTPVTDLDKAMHESYDPSVFDDMPVCLQVVGKNLQDEKALAVAAVIDA